MDLLLLSFNIFNYYTNAHIIGDDERSSQAATRMSFSKKYPATMKMKFLHLIVIGLLSINHFQIFDALNIIFSGVNHYSIGIGIHCGFAALHTFLFGLDVFLRKRGYKKQKKIS